MTSPRPRERKDRVRNRNRLPSLVNREMGGGSRVTERRFAPFSFSLAACERRRSCRGASRQVGGQSEELCAPVFAPCPQGKIATRPFAGKDVPTDLQEQENADFLRPKCRTTLPIDHQLHVLLVFKGPTFDGTPREPARPPASGHPHAGLADTGNPKRQARERRARGAWASSHPEGRPPRATASRAGLRRLGCRGRQSGRAPQ